MGKFYDAFKEMSEEEKMEIVEETKDIVLDSGKTYYESLLERFSDGNGGISESGKFYALWSERFGEFEIVGEKTIWGKAQNDPKLMAFIEGSETMMNLNVLDRGEAGRLLRSSDISVEEFMERWEKVREEYKQKYGSLEGRVKQEESREEEEKKKVFTPIEAESKEEIYTNKDFSNLLKLVQSYQKGDMLSILFRSINLQV